MTARTSNFQSADVVRDVRPAQVKAEPAPPPYVGGGRCGAAAAHGQPAGADSEQDRFDVSAFSPANQSAFSELWDLADGRPDLRAFLARKVPAINIVRKPGRPKREIIETVDKPDRDHVRDQLCRSISATSGEQRRLHMRQAVDLHSAAERIERRKVLIRLWRDRYGKGLSVNQMTERLRTDLDRRRKREPQSTDDAQRDQLCDKILACRFDLSKRTITGDLS